MNVEKRSSTISSITKPAAFKRAIKADPNFADAHYGLSIAYLEMGALDDAKTAAEEASRLKANRQLVHELLTAIKHAETSLHKRKIWKKRLSYAAILGVVIVVISSLDMANLHLQCLQTYQ